MPAARNLPAAILALLLVGCLVAYFVTGEAAAPPAAPNSPNAAQNLVDTTLLQNAIDLAALAATPDEQVQAREAWRLADHEIDLTFAAHIRNAQAQSLLPAPGPLRQLSDRIASLKSQVDADKKRVDALGSDDTDAQARAQAQLELDQDELGDAREDLARAGGDQSTRLQRLLQEHEASDKVADQALKFPSPHATSTLNEQLRAWLSLREYTRRLSVAAQAAAARGRALSERYSRLKAQLPTQQPDASTTVATMKVLSAQRKYLTSLDQRIQDTTQLGAVYQRWSGLVQVRRRKVIHFLLRSLAVILAILLVTVLLTRVIRHSFHATDRRRLHQLRTIAVIALQAIPAVVILIIIFGPPSQLSTIIGLITAAVTVVMKDFIVAFLGWFTLMGKNGISVGDWVEIEGVSGEVIEIGLLKTVLLEMGNWTDTAQPTGRRVAFSNSFAMAGHYFNFSTAGQWRWDEIHITLPPSGDPYQTAHKIGEIVEHETQGDAAEAISEWQRSPHQSGSREFSARPTISLRPAASGLEVVVRYITRAPQGYAARSKLFQQIVELLRQPA